MHSFFFVRSIDKEQILHFSFVRSIVEEQIHSIFFFCSIVQGRFVRSIVARRNHQFTFVLIPKSRQIRFTSFSFLFLEICLMHLFHFDLSNLWNKQNSLRFDLSKVQNKHGSLRFNLYKFWNKQVRFASISKTKSRSKLCSAFVSISLPLLAITTQVFTARQ